MTNMTIPCDSINPRPFKFTSDDARKTNLLEDNAVCVNTEQVKFQKDRNYKDHVSF